MRVILSGHNPSSETRRFACSLMGVYIRSPGDGLIHHHLSLKDLARAGDLRRGANRARFARRAVDIYTKNAREMLAEAGVVFVEQGGRYYLDQQSLRNLEGAFNEIRSKYESLRDLVLRVDASEDMPPVHRLSSKMLKEAIARLTRRMKHLHEEVAIARRAGRTKEQTAHDRKEAAALGMVLPILDAALAKARRENDEHPGGVLLRMFPLDPTEKPPTP